MNPKVSTNKEIGDYQFPLEVNIPEDIVYDHPDVGKIAVINSYANESLFPFRGYRAKILGAIVKRSQTLGYEARILDNNRKFYAPKKDFWVDQKYVEDIYPQSALAVQTREVLSHWDTQRDYYGPSWEGVELLHFEVAKITDRIGIESAGWYKYPSSTRSDMDGKDWRLILTNKPNEATCINCHSLLHDNTWSLATTVYSTRQIDLSKVNFHWHPDHWQRVLLWTLIVAKSLSTQGYNYSQTIKDLERRIKLNQKVLMPLKDTLLPPILAAYYQITRKLPELPELSIGFSRLRMKPTSVGKHEPPSDERAYSIVTIDPIVVHRPSYMKWVINHELIHYVLTTSFAKEAHDTLFQEIADIIGLPEKYQD